MPKIVEWEVGFEATFHLTISMRGERATGKIQRNNYYHGSCEPSLTGKTTSVLKATSHSTIFDIPMRPLREDQKHRHRFTR